MRDGIYFEMFAVKDGVRYNAKIIYIEEVGRTIANSVFDGLEKVMGLEENANPTEKGGAEE